MNERPYPWRVLFVNAGRLLRSLVYLVVIVAWFYGLLTGVVYLLRWLLGLK